MDALALYLPNILLAYGLYVLGLVSPGPNILSVVGASMGVGRKAGIAQAMGVASGSFIWAIGTWTGLTTLLALYGDFLIVIKVFGGVYLLWLGLRAFRAAASADTKLQRRTHTDGGLFTYYRRGLLVQMTNPKALLWWVAVMALGVGAEAPAWVGGTIVAMTTTTSVVGHLAYALLFSTETVVAAYARARRWIEGALGAFFCFASFQLLTSKL